MSVTPDRLIVLGSGTALPTAERGPAGYLAATADAGVLLDAGPGSVRMAARAGFSVAQLRGVLLTHFHVDHSLDVFALLFALRNPALEDCSITLAGPRGTAGLIERMGSVYGDWVRLPADRMRVVELAPGPFEVDFGGLVLRGDAVSMPHLSHSLGYRLEGQRGSFAYSGDTGEGSGPIDLGRDVDLYVLESAFPEGADTTGHLTPRAAGRIARAAGCRRLLLTHFYPETEAAEDPVAAAREEFSGEVIGARDQDVFEV